MNEKYNFGKELPRIFNMSGGRTSALMVLRYWRPGDHVVFTDTGREEPETYKFLDDFERFEKIKINRVSFNDYNKHEPGDSAFTTLLKKKKHKIIPNRSRRFCTEELKIKVAKKYVKQTLKILTFESFLGFRYDEPKRVIGRKKNFKKVFEKFPLFYDGTTKEMVNEFWKVKPYDLTIPSILGNCGGCFMKGKNALIAIFAIRPETATPWIEDEETSAALYDNKGSGRKYFPDVTYRQLLNIAQNNLFKDYDLDEVTPAFNCACGP